MRRGGFRVGPYYPPSLLAQIAVNKTAILFAWSVFAFLCGGCDSGERAHKETLRHGLKTVPHVDEIRRVFQNVPVDHFLTHFRMAGNKPVLWNTQLFFYDRYSFDYRVPVIVDYENNQIVGTAGDPEFLILEILTISDDFLGAKMGANHRFSEAEWNKVVRANGDFSVIGINLVTNSPVAGFKRYAHNEIRGIRTVDGKQ